MNVHAEEHWYGEVLRVLRERLDDPENCQEAIQYCEGLLKSICTYNASLLGAGGARAVLARAISLATRDAPLVEKIAPTRIGGDFTELHQYVQSVECDTVQLLNSFVHLGHRIFLTLSDLTGDTLITPLLEHLDKGN